MAVFAGTERQCTEDEHDDEDENDSQTSAVRAIDLVFNDGDELTSSLTVRSDPNQDHLGKGEGGPSLY